MINSVLFTNSSSQLQRTHHLKLVFGQNAEDIGTKVERKLEYDRTLNEKTSILKQQLDLWIDLDKQQVHPAIKSINTDKILKNARLFWKNQGRNPIDRPYPYLIGIAGGCGSGKTHSAFCLRQRLKKHAPLDPKWFTDMENISSLINLDYYSKDIVDPENNSEATQVKNIAKNVKNFFESEKILKHLKLLKQGKAVYIPSVSKDLLLLMMETYERSELLHDYPEKPTKRLNGCQLISPTPFIITEGVQAYPVKTELGEQFNLKIYLDAPDEVRRQRIVERNKELGESVTFTDLDKWHPYLKAHGDLIEPQKASADIVLDASKPYEYVASSFNRLSKILVGSFQPLCEKAETFNIIA